MILFMTLARCRISTCRAILSLVIFTLFSALLSFAQTWDTEGAARFFQDARRKRSEIAQSPQPSMSQYLDCAKTYRRVYLLDPHYGRSGDAIYEEGLVYQEIGDKFGDLDSYRTAARRFHLLTTDYGMNQNCPDALLRLGNIYSSHLNNEGAAQEAFRRLSIDYKNSSAFSQLNRADPASNPAQPQTGAVQPPEDQMPAAEKTSVQNIRHWSTDEYTRVIIDMDLDAQYARARLSDPYRVYFDISNAKLSPDLKNRTFGVEDAVLKQIRVAQNSAESVRVVLDLSGTSEYSAFELHNPFRIVIDFQRQPGANAGLKPSPPDSVPRSDELGPKPAASQPSRELPAAKRPPAPPSRTDLDKASPSAQSPQTQAKQPSQAAAKIESAPSKEVTPTPAAITKIEPISPKVAKPDPATPAALKAPQAADAATKPAPAANPAAAAIPKAAPPTSHGDRTLTRMLGLKIGRVVIDPGHGGHDLGSMGRGGLLEKDLVLAIAKELQILLEENLGAQVVLTRTDDSFVSLEERTAVANRQRADLFISIHANSSRTRATSGVETYYLDFAATEAEREVAARENATSVSNVRDLEDLIKKIAQADKSMESRELASVVQKRLYAGARKLFPSAQDRGVRKAPFVVLIGANMPSVLVEVAFISNPKDERLLRKEANQKRLTTALYSGIEDYIRTLGVDVVHNQPGAK
jgi:N-acetylmuramoyl-L-alanine amidase